MENLKPILESLLFVADTPLTVDRLKAIIVEAEAKEIRQALNELQEEYRQRRGGFELREVAGGYQFRSRSLYNDWIKRLVAPSPVRLSKAALETLAIIAYKQPVIRSDVEHIRGVDCGGVLRVLLERQLIRVLGRKEIPGRPLIYATTKKFLEVFDLKDLKDLPSPKEIESFGHAIAEGQIEVVEQDEMDSAEPREEAPGGESDPGQVDPDYEGYAREGGPAEIEEIADDRMPTDNEKGPAGESTPGKQPAADQ